MRFKIANIICDNKVKSVQFPSIYCRADAHINPLENGIELQGPGTFDFTTYFNSISVRKWQKYASLNNVSLHLEISGSKGEIELTFANQFSFNSEIIPNTKTSFDATNEAFVCDLQFDKVDAELLGFKINCDAKAAITNSYYFTDVKKKQLNDVELALCTTTFKKEEFIIPNTKMIYESVCESDSEIAKHFTMHIVDNGKTLKEKDFPRDKRIILHPNENVGGSGGFARGMIESIHQKNKATHVLLMDDDVEVSPESIKRTYALMRLVNDEHKDAILSGAMHELDYPYNQWEDVGYIDELGKFRPTKAPLNIMSLRDCVGNEVYTNEQGRYAAWWYSVIPTKTIERAGLPLPLFVRSDDTEYGYRCNSKLMTMNSICIFHKGFHIRYDAAVERYQTTRNTFIANAVTGCASKERFLAQLEDAMVVELKKFNYTNAILALEGFEDFMKGPSFIMQKGIAEEKFLEKHKTCEQLKPLEEAILDVPKKQRAEVISQINRMNAEVDVPRSLSLRVKDKLSLNNQKTVIKTNKKGCVVIPADGWVYTPGKFLGAKSFFAVDYINKKAVFRKKNKKKFREVWKRYKQDLKEFKSIEDQLYADYATCREKITSEAFWRDYLGI